METTNVADRRKDAQAVKVRNRQQDVQASSTLDNKRSGQDNGRASNITETKERGLDRPEVGDIATGAIWRRSVEAPKRRG